jgi:amino-acid N-acetyltransferase
MEPFIRKAHVTDVRAIHRLLLDCAKQAQLLPRSLNQIYVHLRDFYVATAGPDGPVIGCCALSICWEDLAEVRSLAVDEASKGEGIGKLLVDTCLAEAKQLGIARIFALTYVVDFFGKFGFEEVDKDLLPQKVWSDCINCPRFPECDETAMLLDLNLEMETPCPA